jgi:hypothetical protein
MGSDSAESKILIIDWWGKLRLRKRESDVGGEDQYVTHTSQNAISLCSFFLMEDRVLE